MNLVGEINGAIGTMQMVDYPYSTDFLGALPANPVKTACSWAQGNFTNPNQDQAIQQLQIILNVFQNSTGTTDCTNVDDSEGSVKNGLDSDGWDYQTCNEMVMPIFQNGKTDMFYAEAYNPDSYIA